MKTGLFRVALIFAVCLCGIALQFGTYLLQPFQLKPFLRSASKHGFLVLPPPRIAARANELKLVMTFNETALTSDDLTVKGYFIDADRLARTWWLPFSWRTFCRSRLHQNGVSFACNRTILVDARLKSIKLSADSDGSQPLFWHEWAHVTMFDYRFTESGDQWISSHMRAADAFIKRAQWQPARQNVESVLRACPAYCDAIDKLALIERRAGQPYRAITLFRQYAQLNDDDLTRANIVDTYLNDLNDPMAADESIREWEHSAQPDDGEPFYWLGLLQLRRKDAEGALDAFSKARTLYIVKKDQNSISADAFMVGTAVRSSRMNDQLRLALKRFRADCFSLRPLRASAASLCAFNDFTLCFVTGREVDERMKH